MENDTLLSNAQAFRSFVNKLAQVCDNRQGGSTVTALVVLQGHGGPEFIIGSNQREEFDLADTQDFVQRLLELVAKNPLQLKRKPLLKRVLWSILLFNIPRVEAYLDYLLRYLGECIADCARQRLQDTEILETELHNIKAKASFSRDIVTSEQTRDKFLSDCESLIKAIVVIKGSKVEATIVQKAKDGDFASSEPWSAAIIRAMTPEDEDSAFYLAQAEDLQKFNLDGLIKKKIQNKKWRPYVHAEILVHSYLMERGIQHSRKYWNGWKYIGSSKPACRLCSYYFQDHKDRVQVRSSHLNLYASWRLPDVYADQGPIAEQERQELLEKIIDRVQEDVKRTLDEKIPHGKNHDSNTHSRLHDYFQPDSDDCEDGSDTELNFSDTSLSVDGTATSPSVHGDEESGSLQDDLVDKNDEEGGVAV
ncbi:hypothetical protein NKR23_g1159 [Pleurostoma richardsiae]|uniref:Uncharacterized protein n=1 Tax=Pleurostoma richardsiae TaxID=41990 RepID=A0AA38VPQ0_9PEZI|nr:hypothetical protein NKR23_g1159 [Pleurostoma richardsiae]